jgi:flavin-dependent dehydrogenase
LCGGGIVDYDIIIVGAGPAGLSTGLHLAQLAPELVERTLILERERHPRPKLCAGGIMPGGEAWLQKLGLDLTDVPSIDVCEARFPFEDYGFVIRREPYVFRVIRRDEFDAWLADAARARGLTLQENTRVTHVQRLEGENLIEVNTDRGRYRARAVVGADGATGVVRRSVVPKHTRQVSRLLEVLIPAESEVSATSDCGQGDDRPVIIDLSWIADGVQGYIWDFPAQVQGQLSRSRGIFDSRIHPNAPSISIKTVLLKELVSAGIKPDQLELQGHPLRWFHPRGVLSAPGVLLVGDAAGVDPLLGEGISVALGYGSIAAEQLVDGFSRGDLSFRHYRRRVLTHRTGRILGRRHAVAWVIYGIRSRWLLRFLSHYFGPLIGWIAESFLVDWGD